MEKTLNTNYGTLNFRTYTEADQVSLYGCGCRSQINERRAILTSNDPNEIATAEVLGNIAIIVQDDSIEIASAILKILISGDERNIPSKIAVEHMQRLHNPEDIAIKLEQIYQQCPVSIAFTITTFLEQ